MRTLKLLMAAPLFLFFIACEEEGPFINFEEEELDLTLLDTAYISEESESVQDKNVLLEDFTGVQCINCPSATRVAEEIVESREGRVSMLAIHVTETFGSPMPESREDYRIDEGRRIFTEMLSGTQNLPLGSVDRMLFDDQNVQKIGFPLWNGYVNRQLGEVTPVNIHVSTQDYDDENRTVILNTKAFFTQAVDTEVRLSIAISESGIIDYQKYPDRVEPNYELNYTLRAMVNGYNGIRLAESVPQNQVYERQYRISLLDNWEAENCNIHVFVHRGSPKFEVYHVQEIPLLPN